MPPPNLHTLLCKMWLATTHTTANNNQIQVLASSYPGPTFGSSTTMPRGCATSEHTDEHIKQGWGAKWCARLLIHTGSLALVAMNNLTAPTDAPTQPDLSQRHLSLRD